MAEERNPASEQRSPQVDDVLLPARPGRLRDQPGPVPGTGWIEAAEACDLVLTDASLYAQFISGPPHPAVGGMAKGVAERPVVIAVSLASAPGSGPDDELGPGPGEEAVDNR